MALVSFVVVGVSPRTLGRQHSDSVALLASPLIVGLRTFLGPVARVLIALGNAVTPGRGYRDGPFQSESELRDLVDLAGESSVIEAGEREMIHSVFELGDTVAREVMVPRTDMVTIDGEKTLRSAMSLFLRSGFSRIPVVGDGSDDILGLLYFKDVVRRVNADQESGSLPVTAQMRPMHYVPESKPVDDLLREMQRDQSHFAVVVDEYGGTAGLVTIEDIIEEIVGEIADEYDREAPGRRGPRRRHASGSPRRWTSTTSPTCSTSTSRRTRSTPSVASSASPSAGCRSSDPVARWADSRLTAERMAGRRHRIASVIVQRVAVPDERPSRGCPRAHYGGARARGSVMTASGSGPSEGYAGQSPTAAPAGHGARPDALGATPPATSPGSPASSGAPTPASRR